MKEIMRPKKVDAALIGMMCGAICCVWVVGSRYGPLSRVFTYWDGINYFVRRQSDNGWKSQWEDPYKRECDTSAEENLTPLPVHHYLVSLFVMAALGHRIVGQMIYALVMSSISVFLFRRLLLVYGFKNKSVFLCCLFIAFPPRWVLFRSTATYDSLLLCLIMSSLVFYKIDAQIPLLITCFVGLMTRFELMLMPIIFSICYLIAKRRCDASICFLFGVFAIALLQIGFPKWSDYVIPNAIKKGRDPKDIESFTGTLFGFFWTVKGSISNLREIHLLHMVFFPSVFGSALLIAQCLPLSVFGFVYTLFISMIQSYDMNRFAIPVQLLVFLPGIAFFFEDRMVQFVLTILSPIAFLGEAYIAGNQFGSRQFASDLVNYLIAH